MRSLPKWIVTDKFPALYDHESGTAIEMVAKLYGAMQELIEEYNKWVANLEKNINDFEEGLIEDNETFRVELRQEFQDFIDTVELLLKSWEARIEDIEGISLSDFEAFKEEILGMIDGFVTSEDLEEFRTVVEEFRTTINEQSTDISKKLNAPLNENGDVLNGSKGQFLISNGDGTTSWLTVKNGNEVAY